VCACLYMWGWGWRGACICVYARARACVCVFVLWVYGGVILSIVLKCSLYIHIYKYINDNIVLIFNLFRLYNCLYIQIP
jgi:hypothetical protein